MGPKKSLFEPVHPLECCVFNLIGCARGHVGE